MFQRRGPEETAEDAGLILLEEIKGKCLKITIIFTKNCMLLKNRDQIMSIFSHFVCFCKRRKTSEVVFLNREY